MWLSESHGASRPAVAPSPFVTLTVVSVVLVLLSAAWGLVDARLVEGVPVWLKPFKFAVSFALLFATLAVVEHRLSDGVRQGWPIRWVGWIMAAAFLSEMAYIFYAGSLAEASHFNLSTPFHAFMYRGVMATGAVALVACVGWMGWIVKRDTQARLGVGLREGIWLGFMLSFLLTLVVAGYMSTSGRHVGMHPDLAPTLWITGWSAVTGDLRPAHFVALHAMQVLPLWGLWLDKRKSPHHLAGVRMGALVYTVLTVALFVQALMGLPLIRLG